ncbi:MAG: hypothetical protein OMM_13398, partial [Candidatus Magnetoglobus multicellularis str. Araruama]
SISKNADRAGSVCFYQSKDTNSWLFSPGNCWGTNGLWVLYPGYLTPHALEAFSVVNNTDSQQGQGQMMLNYLFYH